MPPEHRLSQSSDQSALRSLQSDARPLGSDVDALAREAIRTGDYEFFARRYVVAHK
jgi:hypothetical protein